MCWCDTPQGALWCVGVTHRMELYGGFPPNWVIKSIRMRWAEHVARAGDRRSAHRLVVRRPEGTRPLGKPRCRWEGNIKMDYYI